MAGLLSCSQEKGDELNQLEKELEKNTRLLNETELKIKDIQARINALSGDTDDRVFEPVVLKKLERITFNHYIEASGSVMPIREAQVSPEINGQIAQLLVKEGDRVSRGQTVARLNTDLAKRSIEELETALNLANDLYNRQKNLWDKKIGSEMQYVEAKSNKESIERRLATLKTQLQMATVTSPINGYVEKLMQKTGELAAPGVPMMYIVDMSELYVRVDVAERYIRDVKRGENVVLRFPAHPDYRMNTRIDRISNLINRNNRTFEVQLKVRNQDYMIKPNMVAVVDINYYSAINTIVIPSNVIREDLSGYYVYIATEQENELIAKKRYIETGRTYLGETQVNSGLEEGEMVIFEGFNRVNDGSLLRRVD
jgi:RND family efflux transporter MFP subunit